MKGSNKARLHRVSALASQPLPPSHLRRSKRIRRGGRYSDRRNPARGSRGYSYAQALSSSLKSELGINHGLKIVEVKDGIFKQKGITDDFIILSVNYQKVSSEKDLNKALSNDRNGKIRIEGINSTGTYNITFEFYR